MTMNSHVHVWSLTNKCAAHTWLLSGLRNCRSRNCSLSLREQCCAIVSDYM